MDGDDLVVHHRLIASADRLMKDAQNLDAIARDQGGIVLRNGSGGLDGPLPVYGDPKSSATTRTHKNDSGGIRKGAA